MNFLSWRMYLKIGIVFLFSLLLYSLSFAGTEYSLGFNTQVTLYQAGKAASINYVWDKKEENVAFSQNGNVWTMKKNGSGKKLISQGYRPCFSEDSKLIVFDYQDSIWIYNKENNELKKVVEGGKNAKFIGNNKFAYLTIADVFRNLWLYNLDSSENIPLTEITDNKRIIDYVVTNSGDKILLNTAQLKEFEEGIKIDTLDIEILDLSKLEAKTIVSEGNGGFLSLNKDDSKAVFVAGYTYNPCIWIYDLQKEEKSLINCFSPYFFQNSFVTTFPGYELGEKVWFPMCDFAADNSQLVCSNYEDKAKNFYISLYNLKGEKTNNIAVNNLPLGAPIYNFKFKKFIFSSSRLRNNQEDSALILFNFLDVLFDNNTVDFMNPPVVKNGIILLPLKALSSAFQAYVEWDNTEKKIIVVQQNSHIELKLNQNYAFVNENKVELEVAPTLIFNQIYAPARFLITNFGGKIIWDDKNYILNIYSTNNGG